MFQNLLFDLDGTLTDSSEGITKCVAYGLQKLGLTPPPRKELEVFIGPPLRASYKKYFGLSDEDAERATAYYRERYTDIGIWENHVYDGIMPLLADLSAKGFKLGMCTAKPIDFAARIAQRFELDTYLTEVTGASMDGKMDNKATVVAASLAKWGIVTDEEKATVVLIGDRREDILAAHANGIKAIGIGWGFAKPGELDDAGADYYCETVEDLRRFLEC